MIAPPATSKTPDRKKCKFAGVAVWCGIIISSVASIYVICNSSDSDEPKQELKAPSKSNVSQVKPAPSVERPALEVRKETKRNVKMERGVEVVAENIRTNQSGNVIEKLTLADGRIIEKVRPKKAIFTNPSDEVIAIALSYKPGQHMAPLPDLQTIDQDFANSLLSPIQINEDDSDDIKEQKLAVKEAKAYIAAEIRNGRSVQECLNEHRQQMESIADSHLMAIQEIKNMRDEGAPEEDIDAFRSRINEVFRGRGIPELPMPKGNQGE